MADGKEELDLSIKALFSCQGYRVVVTGGTRGIGLMLATAYVQNGATVYMFSRRPEEGVAETLNKKGPGRAVAMVCDVADEERVQQVAAEIAKLEPDGIHVLINNSGAVWAAPFDSTPKSSFDKLLSVNVTGLFMVSQAFAPLLEKTAKPLDPARIINIASIDGIRTPAFEEYAYCASKSAVLHLTRIMSAHLAPRHITCNAISPGLFPSKMSAQVVKLAGDTATTDMIPQKRLGRPEDIAAVCLFLSGPGGAYTSGANIVVDGGLCVKQQAVSNL
eukprot:TRINITY_DN20858_c0_g2_i1.p1 TRINITY_DN20858_c0_g2~~TRINITY_DN20858_c0_g2_i1.p1  ORF type:complete len:276 (-),score=44.70 TRINITY_DN20858_c0_g2_i1:43-870(-)